VAEVLVQAHPRQPPAYQARERGFRRARAARARRASSHRRSRAGWRTSATASPDCRLSGPIYGRIVSIGRLPQTVLGTSANSTRRCGRSAWSR